jgi:hypothetical protein
LTPESCSQLCAHVHGAHEMVEGAAVHVCAGQWHYYCQYHSGHQQQQQGTVGIAKGLLYMWVLVSVMH